MGGTQTQVEGLPSFRALTLRSASSSPENSLEAGFVGIIANLQDRAICYVEDQDANYRWFEDSVAAPVDPDIIIPLGQALATPGRWIIESSASIVTLTGDTNGPSNNNTTNAVHGTEGGPGGTQHSFGDLSESLTEVRPVVVDTTGDIITVDADTLPIDLVGDTNGPIGNNTNNALTSTESGGTTHDFGDMTTDATDNRPLVIEAVTGDVIAVDLDNLLPNGAVIQTIGDNLTADITNEVLGAYTALSPSVTASLDRARIAGNDLFVTASINFAFDSTASTDHLMMRLLVDGAVVTDGREILQCNSGGPDDSAPTQASAEFAVLVPSASLPAAAAHTFLMQIAGSGTIDIQTDANEAGQASFVVQEINRQ